VLDDHVEGWFLGFGDPPQTQPEGLASVAGLGLSQAWLPPPACDGRQDGRSRPLEPGDQADGAGQPDAGR
jgi:hypothetical protein